MSEPNGQAREVIDPEYIEERFYWGLCYCLLDVKRKAAVMIKARPLGTRKRAKELLKIVPDGRLSLDLYSVEPRRKMQEWRLQEVEG